MFSLSDWSALVSIFAENTTFCTFTDAMPRRRRLDPHVGTFKHQALTPLLAESCYAVPQRSSCFHSVL